MGMKLLGAFWERLDEAKAKVDGPYLAVIDDRSSLRLDDRYLGAWRGGGLATGALNAAVDALQTIRVLMTEARVVPMMAIYPLLRMVIENAALAVYLLAPVDRDERLRRTYCVADDDARLRSVNEQERGFEGWADKRSQVRAELRGLIQERGSLGDPATFEFARVHYSDLMARAGDALEADPAVEGSSELTLLAMWQLLSGLSHGKQWAMIEVLERSQAIVDEENASARVRFSTSPAAVAWFMERALQPLECALRLFGYRSKVTYAQPEDADEPPLMPYVEQRRERLAEGSIPD